MKHVVRPSRSTRSTASFTRRSLAASSALVASSSARDREPLALPARQRLPADCAPARQ
jgi:hypothetical protein